MTSLIGEAEKNFESTNPLAHNHNTKSTHFYSCAINSLCRNLVLGVAHTLTLRTLLVAGCNSGYSEPTPGGKITSQTHLSLILALGFLFSTHKRLGSTSKIMTALL
jgi:hypothetical protein